MKKIKIPIIIFLLILTAVIGYLFAKNRRTNTPYTFNPFPQVPGDKIMSPDEMKRDMDYVVSTLTNVHPKAYMGLDGEQLSVIDEAYKKIEYPMEAQDFYFVLNEIICSFKDAHTNMSFQRSGNLSGIRLSILWLNDGMYVGNDIRSIRRGDKILSIGGKGEEELLKELSRIIPAENPQWVKALGSQYLILDYYLRHLGLISDEGVEVRVLRNGSEITEVLPLEKLSGGTGFNSGKFVEYKIDKENSLGVFTLNSCEYNEEYISTLRSFFKEVRENKINNVAVDVRENTGGNSMVVDEFLRYIDIDKYYSYSGDIRYSKEAQIQRGHKKSSGYVSNGKQVVKNKKVGEELIYRGNLYVLTSPITFSSANWFAVIIKDNNIGKIIGEPTGNQPSSYGDILSFQTPEAGFCFSVSYKKWVRPDESRDPEDCLNPDIVVYRRIEDILNNRDTQIEELKAIVNGKK